MIEALLVLGAIVAVSYGLSSWNDRRKDAAVRVVNERTQRMQQVQRPKTRPVANPRLNVDQADVNTVKLSDEQAQVFNLLETTNDNYFVTGKAGTGKSVLLKYFEENSGKRVVLLSPTGVAALNIGGQTIHSFFKLAPITFDKDELESITVDYKLREILRNIDTVVIDEVSMVRADLMEAISRKLQIARRNDEPFGGVQLALFGDPYQLPPVVTDGQLDRYFKHTYGGYYFFNAPSVKATELQVYELQHVFRQKDEEFRELLNTIRHGAFKESQLAALNERAKTTLPESGFITLAGHNATVSAINHKELAKLPGQVHEYEAEVWGDIKEQSFPTEKKLKLKVGAQVMMLKNDTEKPRRWANGTLGVVTMLKKDLVRVNIDGVEHTILPATWEKIRYDYDHEERRLDKQVVSSFKQLPLRLAWAITIHKSQGQTYQSVAVDLSDGAFAHGQTYVALSRCVSLEGLYLESPIRREDVIVDPDVVAFMKKAKVTG